MAGDTDEPDEPLLASLDGSLERAALAERELPLDDVDEVVELQEVDVVDAQPLQ